MGRIPRSLLKAPEMSAGELGSPRRRFDFDFAAAKSAPTYPKIAEETLPVETRRDPLGAAIASTTDYLLAQQHDDGYWVGELEGDTILESEYILLLTFLNLENSEQSRLAGNYICEEQLPEGGWAIYPGGPLEISASVKAYFALKILGHNPAAEYMIRARRAILHAGGVEKVNSFTRFYLALLGEISYRQCPAVPPELMLVPKWMPLNIYEMSAWSRTIIVPLSLLWAFQPVRKLSAEQGIAELFCGVPEDLPVCMPPSEALDPIGRKTWIDWRKLFGRLDRGWKILERLHIKPLRKLAIRRATNWMLARFKNSDGLGAIFPPIVWSVVALKCLGYDDDSPEVVAAMNELEKLSITSGDTLRLQPCQSPVWDTAITTLALREADVPRDHPAIKQSVNWLLSKEVRQQGDWSVRNPDQPVGGWFFEFENAFYPDVDDTAMVLMALARCLPASSGWSADFLVDEWSPHEADKDAAAVLAGRSGTAVNAVDDIDSMTPILTAIWRGARWMLSMQCKDGGWGAFDADNDREIFTRVPFADHNAMIDPSTADITARVLEMFGMLNASPDHPAMDKAIEFVWNHQETDHAWYGRWGVNYIYGTWQVIVGLKAVGVPATDRRLKSAAAWLKSVQQQNGGWGETPRSYDEPHLRGQGPVTPSQTAWALMGLMAAGETNSEAVVRGVQHLLDHQKTDGTWDETEFTGTGFPRVFYLKYHLYRIYFPLMALARYDRLRGQ
jgi:squalene-hopene/tetraprenyl-beta-curcumene cyclase